MVSSENSHIFIWKDFSEWKLALEDMFKDILTPELETKAKQNAANIEGYDDGVECKKLIGQSIEQMITTEKINEFRRRYSHIRVYHGCRPTNVQSYYDKGILPSLKAKDIVVERFREIFLSGSFPELTEEMLQQSIVKTVRNDKDLCLAVDTKHMLKRAGHYLIYYGGEYLGGLITSLSIENSQEKYFPVLRKIGKPTFIVINLPIEYVGDIEIFAVIERMITEWVYLIAQSKSESCAFDCTVSLLEVLPPEHICSHYHPKKIIDPVLEIGKIYDAETGEYEEQNSEE